MSNDALRGFGDLYWGHCNWCPGEWSMCHPGREGVTLEIWDGFDIQEHQESGQETLPRTLGARRTGQREGIKAQTFGCPEPAS